MSPVAIVGAGITGLTAAFYLQQRGVPVVLYEASGRTGGMIHTRVQDGFLTELGLREGPGEAGYGILERLWERPTLEVNGLSGGGKYTVIPHLAVANVSCRLVPGQDPDAVAAAIVAHVAARDQALAGVRAHARVDQAKVPAYTIPASHPAIEAATAALAAVYPGRGVLHANIAGTLPATALFEDVLGAKTLFFSFSTSDENLHAPNEFLRIPRLREGMRAWETLWRNLATGLGKGVSARD